MTNNSYQGTLLIVDDMPTNLKMLFSYLRQLGFKVLVAQNGEDALVRVAHAPPDLILLDVMMPQMDGFETCGRLKENEATRDIPVIFMTALSETVDKVKGFEVGAVDYITKPVQHEEVLARITTHLTLRRLQKTLEEKNQLLEQQNIQLKEQNAELEAFAHTVAHDLKNPLSGITALSSLLVYKLASSLEAQSLDLLQRIKQSGLKMANIIDALLLLASSRHQKVDMDPLSMVEMITSVQQRLAHTIEESQGEIVISPEEWPTALGYAPWIEEVWANYISNGLKYGGRPPHLELGATPEKGHIRFWVRDNGEGLTSEQQSQLFVPFTRLSTARVEGHGLGLSIVQRVINRCGGQVGVESQVGQGSRFYFTLPASEIAPASTSGKTNRPNPEGGINN
ncbi:MAG: hybrid sensor histidine kinase/response regulator [Candidatus Parabeggiatoa sp. nov. 2]|nr:MAG: hybrid sensor histidine kinase/response regulator [Beggiatoa sp. 4572_84]RKZ64600.1 MAG: hybrid sensor histidine kinase/response regulator [Gammaproteobacteria bacterium]